MAKHHPTNERIKHEYFSHIKDSAGGSEATIDAIAKALARFEADTKYRDFRQFRKEQAVAFKRRLLDQRSQQTGERLSKATVYSTLMHLKKFFLWLAGQPGYKSRLHYSDVAYFNLSMKDVRIATARRDRAGPTLEQIWHVVLTMPAETELERRNRALIAFTLLTGARDRAIASMKLKHIDLTQECVFHDARDVETKFSKTFTTFFFPVGEDVRKIVVDWVIFLRQDKLWGNDDPLFPKTRVEVNAKHQFEPTGLERKHWSDAGPIRKIFGHAFTQAGLPYFNPHSFRKTLACLGERVCKTAEEFKAWSQNLGHDRPLTTFLSYGAVGLSRQAEIIKALGISQDRTFPGLDEVEALLRKMREELNRQRGQPIA